MCLWVSGPTETNVYYVSEKPCVCRFQGHSICLYVYLFQNLPVYLSETSVASVIWSVCVCVSGVTWTCVYLCVSSPGCCCLPSLDEYLFCLSPSRPPTQAHMCSADEEGVGVSASSCVTRLISPQPGRLGPEGSGGGGAGPHSPSDKYVFGAAVLKGHGGRRRRRGGLHCAVLLGPNQA